jgi:hypothetical protein
MHDWSPAIGTALKSAYRWLDVYCAGCRQVKPIDLATIDIHPQACLTSLILLLRCRQCGGHGPLPKLIGCRDSRPLRLRRGNEDNSGGSTKEAGLAKLQKSPARHGD